MCTKRGYRRNKHAKRALKQLQSLGYKLRATYHCKECGLWHLTSQSRWKDDLDRCGL